MPSTLISIALLDPQWRKWRLRAALAMYAAILVMGSIPGARAEIGQVASGIILHSVAYAILALLIYGGSTGSSSLRALKAIGAVMAMGAGDELVQSFLSYRHGDIHDWYVDVTAATLCAALLRAFAPNVVLER